MENLKQLRFDNSNFDLNAMLRGAQLTIVGAHRALQNPGLFTSDHYRQAAIAVCAGIAIRMAISIPIVLVRILLWIFAFVVDFEKASWDDHLVGGLDFIANSVLQVPFFLMTLMRYITPTMDNMFMESLRWVDTTYVQKHKSEDPSTLRAMYYPNLVMYSTHGEAGKKKSPRDAMLLFLMRYGKRAGLSLAIYLVSFVPYIGHLVLPAASFYTFNRAVGPVPAAIVFGSGLFLPKRYLVHFLQSYFSSRSLMRELLQPYFLRVRFSSEQKRRWFMDREGILFGFAVGFYTFLKIPLLGVLIYGVAEASTAYLVTKITDPPPAPAHSENFVESQVRWQNKHEFLKLPLEGLDKFNISAHSGDDKPQESRGITGKKYT